METPAEKRVSPWRWIPTLYFAQGIPYVVVMTMSVILYKRLGVSNGDIALYTSWLYLPWVIKPLWSPLVELIGTKRQWTIAMQLVIGAALGSVALTLPGPDFFKVTLGIFWLMAFASATHDIAADGFYILALEKHQQAWFVGVRSTCYRLAMIAGQGLLIMLAGAIEIRTGLPALELKVEARAGAPIASLADPAAFQRAAENEAPLRLRAEPSAIVLDPAISTAAAVDGLLTRARAWNVSRGFYRPAAAAGNAADGAAARKASWWSRHVAAPIGGWLRRNFGAQKTVAPTAVGQAGFFAVTLSRPPEKDVVVNLGREVGDKGMKLLEGERFTFTPDNWNQPMLVVVQLDPKNPGTSEATFVARAGNIPLAWAITFYTLAALFVVFFVHHKFGLPRPAGDRVAAAGERRNPLREFVQTFATFFAKPYAARAIAFLLLYRFAESQLVKIASLFFLDGREAGGLGLSTSAVGFVYGTVGVVALTLGGLCGGFVAARVGLKAALPGMVAAINIPNVVYIYLAVAAPDNLVVINACVAAEQFGYGFGFAAYLVYMLYIAQGAHQTAHYAICTGFMALGMMIPGMAAGWLQEQIGYTNFFIWVCIATIPSFVVSALIKVDPAFGRKATS